MSKIHAFFIEEIGKLGEIISINDTELVHQWTKVLRFMVGEEIKLFDALGMEADVEVVSIEKNKAEVKILNIKRNLPAQRANERGVAIYMSIIKSDRFEWAVQKCVEIGVQKIVPLITERTIKKDIKIERLRVIAKEACEQSMRAGLVEISEPMRLVEAVAEAKSDERVGILTDYDGNITPRELYLINKPAIFIGPEGGFTAKEKEFMTKSGMKIVSFGPSILRAETTSVVAAGFAVCE